MAKVKHWHRHPAKSCIRLCISLGIISLAFGVLSPVFGFQPNTSHARAVETREEQTQYEIKSETRPSSERRAQNDYYFFESRTEDGARNALTMMDVINKDPRLTAVAKVIKDNDLEVLFASKKPFTFFAPTNEAFGGKYLHEIKEAEKITPKYLMNIMLDHIVREQVDTQHLRNIKQIKTATGRSLPVSKEVDLTVGGARIISANNEVENGTIHLVDRLVITDLTRYLREKQIYR